MAVRLIIGKNDLLSVNPSLASEWDYEKNKGIRPEMVTSGSSKKIYWIGKCGHKWMATIASRNSGVGCPVCARVDKGVKIRATAVRKHGSLKENDSELLRDWDYRKNTIFGPDEITLQSHRIVWWKCHICSYEWEAVIRNRVKSKKCPNCSNIKQSPKKVKRTPITLAIGNPKIAFEWHPTKNGELTPLDVSAGSHKKVWWKCVNGHEWEASPNHRTSKIRNCPYCCANPRVLTGVNDLATLNPKLVREWNYEKNGSLTPDKITASSSRKIWWKCALGHEWKTSVNHRNDGSGCPRCAKGKQTSFPEQAVFYYVSQAYPDAVNGYTELFNNHGMELDVFIPSLKIGIEYDGIAFHHSKLQKLREKKKYSICHAAGITLIRLREDVDDQKTDTCDQLILLTDGIDAGIKNMGSYGISVSDVNVERDQNKIDARYRSVLRENSLQNRFPDIVGEWDYSKNAPLTPDMFMTRSNRMVWWKCSLGHGWKATIDARTRGTGCPYCSNNKILKGFNDLTSKRSDLMKEWDFELNTDIDPTTISAGSGKKVWWKCVAGHSWKVEVSSRNKGHGCPYCAGNRI